jgi:hypothetical protein
MSRAFFLALERRVWEALKRGDMAADLALLSDDFLGVYSTGFQDRAKHAARLKRGPVFRSYAISKSRLIRLGPGLALLAYAASAKDMKGRGRSFHITSIWRRSGRRWLNIFSQDTDVGAVGGTESKRKFRRALRKEGFSIS